jgi:hypothetical protein
MQYFTVVKDCWLTWPQHEIVVITAISCEILQGGSKVKTTGIIILICNICYVGEDSNYVFINCRLWHILLVFWPYSVFGQNHLCVMMRQTGIPLFIVKSEEFQSSLLVARTPICLLFHPSGRHVILSGRHVILSGRRVSSVRTPTPHREASVQTWSVQTFQQQVQTPISSRTVHWFFPSSRKGRSINRPDDVVSRPDAYLRKARIAIQNEPSGHLTAVVRTLVHRIW